LAPRRRASERREDRHLGATPRAGVRRAPEASADRSRCAGGGWHVARDRRGGADRDRSLLGGSREAGAERAVRRVEHPGDRVVHGLRPRVRRAGDRAHGRRRGAARAQPGVERRVEPSTVAGPAGASRRMGGAGGGRRVVGDDAVAGAADPAVVSDERMCLRVPRVDVLAVARSHGCRSGGRRIEPERAAAHLRGAVAGCPRARCRGRRSILMRSHAGRCVSAMLFGLAACGPDLPEDLGDHPWDRVRLVDVPALSHFARATQDGLVLTVEELYRRRPAYTSAPDPTLHFEAMARAHRALPTPTASTPLRVLSYNLALLDRWYPFAVVASPEVDRRRARAPEILLG